MHAKYQTDPSITTATAVIMPRNASTTLEIEEARSLSIACMSAEKRDVMAPDDVLLKNDIFASRTLPNSDEWIREEARRLDRA